MHYIWYFIMVYCKCQEEQKEKREGEDVMEILEQTEKELRRDYQRKWRKRNPDKVRESNRRYWEKKAKMAISAKDFESNFID